MTNNNLIYDILNGNCSSKQLDECILEICKMIRKEHNVNNSNNDNNSSSKKEWIDLIKTIEDIEYNIQFIDEKSKILFFFHVLNRNDKMKMEMIKMTTPTKESIFLNDLRELCNKQIKNSINCNEFLSLLLQSHNRCNIMEKTKIIICL